MTKFVAAGLLASAVLVLAGCGGPATTPTPAPTTGKGDGHDHPDEGPHHGALVEWGGKLHAEFTVDHKKQEARVYILGKDAKKPAPIKADKVLLSMKEPAFQVELKPERQKDDPEGEASVFVGKHEKLGKEQDFAGTLSTVVGGKPYAGDFKHAKNHKD